MVPRYSLVRVVSLLAPEMGGLCGLISISSFIVSETSVTAGGVCVIVTAHNEDGSPQNYTVHISCSLLAYFLTENGVFLGTGVNVPIHLFQFLSYVCTSTALIKGKGKGKIHPRTGHEGQAGE